MKIIIGLGNPGEKFRNNRHNVGCLFVNWVVRSSEFVVRSGNLKLTKSDVFMNNSGSFVQKLTTNYRLPTANLYIVHDDLDIPLGQYKIQFGVGPKVHYGINSIEGALGTKDFWRVRIGVDNRGQRSAVSGQRVSGEEYVLEDFLPEEIQVLDNIFPKLWEELIQKITKI